MIGRILAGSLACLLLWVLAGAIHKVATTKEGDIDVDDVKYEDIPTWFIAGLTCACMAFLGAFVGGIYLFGAFALTGEWPL